MDKKSLLSLRIANKVKELKREKKLTNDFLAEAMGIGEAYVRTLLRGEKRFNLIHIEKLCAALDDYPVARLFEDDTYPQEEISPGRIAQNQADPMEWALVEVFRGLSSRHKGEMLGVAEDLRLAEAIPPRASKKASAA